MAGNKQGKGVLWALLSGCLLLLAQPPFGFVLLPFLCLVPLLVGLGSIPAGSRGGGRATVLASLFGMAFWGVALVWVPVSVGPRFPWAYPAYLGLILILAGISGAFGFITHYFHRGRGWPLSLAVPIAWVGMEWLKAHFPLGLSFPWLGLAVSLTPWPHFLVLAEFAGEPAVAFWLAGVNGLIAEGVLGSRSLPGARHWFLTGALVLFPILGGSIRARTLPVEEGPLVLAVGTEPSKDSSESPGNLGEGDLEGLSQVRKGISGRAADRVDVLVLPEGLIPLPPTDMDGEEARSALMDLAAKVGAPLVFGAPGGGGEEEGPTNSAYLMSVDGKLVQRYDKVRLVPGMEAGAYSRGKEGVTFPVGPWAAAPLICYESLFSEAARQGRRAGAHFLMNLSSDVWFGREDSWMGSYFLQQHPAHLVLRAVETRTSVARAAKGGFTLLLDPSGREISQVVPPGRGSIQGRLPVFTGSTVFLRTGDWVGPGSFLICLAAFFFLLLAARPGER